MSANVETFYRVECYNVESKRTIGGYVSAIDTMIKTELGISPFLGGLEYAKILATTENDFVVSILFTAKLLLSNLSIPTVYAENAENICLYRHDEFKDKLKLLNAISLELSERNPFLKLIVKEFGLKSEEMLYDDCFQIVISREVYDEHNKKDEYKDLGYYL